MDDYHEKEKPADMVIYEGNVMEKDAGSWRAIAEAWQSERVFAKLYFKWRIPESARPSGWPSGEEYGYVFEKLTGLPRRLYNPGNDYTRDDHVEPTGRLEKDARIVVVGGKYAVQALSPMTK